ncbi:hypothetical protein CAP35_13105 [Chitinophagaceae bacterium IBVUCB1]|nr:hypothetical protein CAP35_13105 [Chitinophagaceae bacterium IBVUCB1]
MASIYKGRLAIVNNLSNNDKNPSSIDISVKHTCNNTSTWVFNGLQLGEYEVAQPAEFHSQAGKDDNWDITLIMYRSGFSPVEYSGSFKANYEQKDAPHVILLNLRALVTDTFDNVIMVFPLSHNVSATLSEAKS